MAWWKTISILERFFWLIAVGFSPLFLFNLIQTLLGFSDFGGEMGETGDSGGDEGGDSSADFRLFTLRNIIIFFTVFGWGGIAFIHAGWEPWRVVISAFALALGVMFLVARLFTLTTRLTETGTLDLQNAIGKTARVYLFIPAHNQAAGKVHIHLQEGLRELAAATAGSAISTGATVKVVDIQDNCLLVEPLKKGE